MSASRRCCPCGERVVSLLFVLLKDVLLKDVMGDGNKLFDMVAPDAGAPFALLAAATHDAASSSTAPAVAIRADTLSMRNPGAK